MPEHYKHTNRSQCLVHILDPEYLQIEEFFKSINPMKYTLHLKFVVFDWRKDGWSWNFPFFVVLPAEGKLRGFTVRYLYIIYDNAYTSWPDGLGV